MKAKHLLAVSHASDNLRIFEGGDLDILGSFDEAFFRADGVIHTAAEVALGASESIITASVDGTMNVLKSVDRSLNVKRFVQTSSVAAIQKYDQIPGYQFTENDWNDWSSVEKGMFAIWI